MRKQIITLLFGASFTAALVAGTDSIPVFATDTLPSTPGDYFSVYAASDVPVSPSIYGAPSDEPQTWDFSAERGSNEAEWRYDIVPISEVPGASLFPANAHAEQLTNQGSGEESWEIYGILDEGRAYYGLVAPPSASTSQGVVFDPVTIDLPREIRFADKWDRTLTFTDSLLTEIGEIELFVQFTANACVDAYGKVILPNIGSRPALRVNELHTYKTTTAIGIPLPTQYFRHYYWVVAGIGKAVEVLSAGSTTEPPLDFREAASVERTFASSLIGVSVKNLKIQWRGEDVFVSWSAVDSGTVFTIAESDSAMATSTEWTVLAETSDTFFFKKLDKNAVSRFFWVSYTP